MQVIQYNRFGLPTPGTVGVETVDPTSASGTVSAPVPITDDTSSSDQAPVMTFDPIDITAKAPSSSGPSFWTTIGNAIQSLFKKPAPVAAPIASTNVLGIPNEIFYVGVGVLALGGLMLMSRRSGGTRLAGYRRRRRRSRR